MNQADRRCFSQEFRVEAMPHKAVHRERPIEMTRTCDCPVANVCCRCALRNDAKARCQKVLLVLCCSLRLCKPCTKLCSPTNIVSCKSSCTLRSYGSTTAEAGNQLLIARLWLFREQLCFITVKPPAKTHEYLAQVMFSNAVALTSEVIHVIHLWQRDAR